MTEETAQNSVAPALWQIRLDAPVSHKLMPLADGVLVPVQRGARASVRRIHADHGDDLWETMFDGPLVAGLARTGDTLAVPLTEGRLVALDVRTGAGLPVQWQQQMGEFCDPVFARKGDVYIRLMSGTGTKFQAFSAGVAAPRWAADDPSESAPAARIGFASDGLIIAGNEGDGNVRVAALASEDGALKWSNALAEGSLQDLYAIANIVDVVTDMDGILGLNAETGELRNQRFSDFPFEEAYEIGETLIMVTRAKGDRVMFTFSSLGEQMQGRLREPMERVVGCSPSEILVTMDDGVPALLTLPELEVIELPDGDIIGPCSQVAFANDIAYLVGEDRHTLTALDLTWT